MFKSFWIFGYNPSYDPPKIVQTVIDIELGSHITWQRFMLFKDSGLYFKLFDDHELRLALRRKRGRAQVIKYKYFYKTTIDHLLEVGEAVLVNGKPYWKGYCLVENK